MGSNFYNPSAPIYLNSLAIFAEFCVKLEYETAFELIFYCYYAFPTDYPEDIRKIFGREYFNQSIEPEAAE
ncbi:MAG: hypothetical protein JEZ06_13665 [Anaerolineaceae bacterium]|nr:hypothetical protein [Anaerolineaceae bacterium]